MSRKIVVILLGFAMITFSLIGYGFTIYHWWQIDWNASSYFWASPMISIVGTICYFGVLMYDRLPFKRQKALWVMGFVWLGFDLLWLWMVDFK